MSVETELKLSIAPEHLRRLKRHPFLKSLGIARATTHRLVSVYYDTPALDLRRKGMALRLRRAGRHWLQTLKGGGSVQAGLHQRNELEMPVSGEALELDALQAAGGKLPRGARKKLRALFTTEFSRSVRLLKFAGAEIELCMDSGEIRAGEKKCPVCELELELKSGEPQQLFQLALALLDVVPLEVEHTSKAEYGYRLCVDEKPAVCRASFLALDETRGIAPALQSMIASCLLHLQANVPGAIRKLDEEYLHQVRVALRRLRVVLAMAENFRADEALHKLHAEVAELCIEFGRLREWDVFVTQTLAPARAAMSQHAALRDVLDASDALRERHQAEVEARLGAQDYQRFLLRFGVWMHGPWSRAAAATELALRDFAVQVLDKRARRVGRCGAPLASADAAQLHALRIACKKLRYSAEMFATLFTGTGNERYVDALAQLQDILGALNDIAVARRLLDELENDARHEALMLLRGWLERDYAYRISGLHKAWKKFSAQKRFWD